MRVRDSVKVSRCYAGVISSAPHFSIALIPLFFSLIQDHVANVTQALAMNAINSNQITADERLNEIAELMALGLMRLLARQSSPFSPDGGESSLDCPGHQSGHANALKSHGGSV
jgi:hypothetical protein